MITRLALRGGIGAGRVIAPALKGILMNPEDELRGLKRELASSRTRHAADTEAIVRRIAALSGEPVQGVARKATRPAGTPVKRKGK